MALESLRDKLNRGSAGLARKTSNISNAIGGTLVDVLRITHSVDNPLPGKNYDAYGYSEKKLSQFHAETLTNVGLAFPGKMEIFQERVSNGSLIQTVTFDLIEFLPIRMSVDMNIPGFALGGNPDESPINIKRNDLIIYVFKDELNNKVPIVMRVEKQYTDPMGRHFVYKEYHLTLELTDLDGEVQDKINEWLVSQN